MTRIAPNGSKADREAVKNKWIGRIPECEQCDREATIWIRVPVRIRWGIKRTEEYNLFLCDVHAFHLGRIIMQDIGHAFEHSESNPKS